ncbi:MULTISPECIES: hypothetical protein [unclassified Arcicella]|uniref:hypothetical protein n=1 Tax=unclassified Arcicella TaxID=2644986 RepID=UPI002861CE3F|nr:MULTISPECIES: hypothetical protein [unclassified Arcicella]MDR6561887.1 hypothetical protein [Arcicella sp. BE51]MDR6814033.1 hypothetical protein [Arcicella sp. BE140]MDR6825260.1 hypothetical protein [Arcicella sp. BE139]
MKSKKQANQYDKIFKENIEAVIPSLMENILGITAVLSEELPDDIQHTKERKPDVLKKITDIQDNTFVLQIEFQVVDEPNMIYRMAEYNVMLARKYKLPIEQFVIYLGSAKPKFSTRIESKLLNYNFPLITFSELDYHIFLKSDKPEEIILSILANFREEEPKNVLKEIIHRIEETTEGDFSLRRYIQQLRVLSQLRNLEQKLKEIIMISIAEYINEEKDPAFMIAKEREQTKFVTNLLNESDFSIEKIAKVTGVSLDFVKNIQQQLKLLPE